MALFHTPLARISYEDVIAFCETFVEGVRVEYKREAVNIPKVVSSLANTVGGIWVVGVDADKKTNRAILPPVGCNGVGLEEKIVQAAQMGVYPSITPSVRVFPVPNSSTSIAVVKVDESIEAPHAIENRTRVYVRNENTTEAAELSDIDRIEYLLGRRRRPEERREQLIAGMIERSWVNGPRMRVVVAPLYPRGVLLPLDELVDRIDTIANMSGHKLSIDERRIIQSGVLSMGFDASRPRMHFEADVHGVVFFEAPASTHGPMRADDDQMVRFVYLYNLLVNPAVILNYVTAVLRGMVTNIMIRYELLDWSGITFFHDDPGRFIEPGHVARVQRCIQPHVVATSTTTLEGLAERRVGILTDLMQQALWAFNYRNSNLAQDVAASLKANQVI